MKAISPVVATVILIAITLIAAIAITVFVFGLFGNWINPPCSVWKGNVTLHNAAFIPVAYSYPNGTIGISYANCNHNNYQIIERGTYPNGTAWYIVGK